MNFLFENKLEVDAGDTIVVRVTEEPLRLFLLGSWKIPCEFLNSLTDNTKQTSPETTKNLSISTTHTPTPTATPTPTIDPNKIAMPIFDTYTGTYKEAVDLLKKAEFINIKTKVKYSLDTGFFGSLFLYDCDEIFVNNQTSFSKGDLFDKNSKIIITYKDYKIKDPSIDMHPKS